MHNWFWDSSALVKLYFAELGSGQVRLWLADQEHHNWITGISRAEISSAIVRRMTPVNARRYLAQFDSDVLAFHISSTDDALLTSAVALVRGHRLRGCDGLQLAAAVRLAAESSSIGARLGDLSELCVFVSADDALNAAATAEGLRVRTPGG